MLDLIFLSLAEVIVSNSVFFQMTSFSHILNSTVWSYLRHKYPYIDFQKPFRLVFLHKEVEKSKEFKAWNTRWNKFILRNLFLLEKHVCFTSQTFIQKIKFTRKPFLIFFSFDFFHVVQENHRNNSKNQKSETQNNLLSILFAEWRFTEQFGWGCLNSIWIRVAIKIRNQKLDSKFFRRKLFLESLAKYSFLIKLI